MAFSHCVCSTLAAGDENKQHPVLDTIAIEEKEHSGQRQEKNVQEAQIARETGINFGIKEEIRG